MVRTGSTYSQCYSEGSCNRGQILSDMACFGEQCFTNETVRHKFGCCETYASAFKAQEADGIVGLSNTPDTLIAELIAHHGLKQNVFALCFGKSRGALTVGGTYLKPLQEDLLWVKLESSTGFYTVQVSGMSLNGKVLSNPGTPIIDSGSTFTYIPRPLHIKAKAAFDEFCAIKGNCMGTKNPEGTPKEDVNDAIACYAPPPEIPFEDAALEQWMLSSFPPISFNFASGQAICMPANSYFFLSNKEHRSFCIGIFPENKFIIGAITMSDFTVVFDHENQRVGWARSNCDGDNIAHNVTCCGKTCKGSYFTRSPVRSPPTPKPTAKRNPEYENVALSGGIGTDSPTMKPKGMPLSFWEGGVRTVSAYFFFLGIFVALVCVCTVWLCQPSAKPANVGLAGASSPDRREFQSVPTSDIETELSKA